MAHIIADHERMTNNVLVGTWGDTVHLPALAGGLIIVTGIVLA